MALKHMEVLDPAAIGLSRSERRSVGISSSRTYRTNTPTLSARPLAQKAHTEGSRLAARGPRKRGAGRGTARSRPSQFFGRPRVIIP